MQNQQLREEQLRLDVAEAKRRLDAGEAIVLDVVAPHVWEQMHRAIAGAVRIEPNEIERRYHELPGDKQTLAYCT